MKALTVVACDHQLEETSQINFRSYMENRQKDGSTNYLLNISEEGIILTTHLQDTDDGNDIISLFYKSFKPQRYTITTTPIPNGKPYQSSRKRQELED